MTAIHAAAMRALRPRRRMRGMAADRGPLPARGDAHYASLRAPDGGAGPPRQPPGAAAGRPGRRHPPSARRPARYAKTSRKIKRSLGFSTIATRLGQGCIPTPWIAPAPWAAHRRSGNGYSPPSAWRQFGWLAWPDRTNPRPSSDIKSEARSLPPSRHAGRPDIAGRIAIPPAGGVRPIIFLSPLALSASVPDILPPEGWLMDGSLANPVRSGRKQP